MQNVYNIYSIYIYIDIDIVQSYVMNTICHSRRVSFFELVPFWGELLLIRWLRHSRPVQSRHPPSLSPRCRASEGLGFHMHNTPFGCLVVVVFPGEGTGCLKQWFLHLAKTPFSKLGTVETPPDPDKQRGAL